MAAFTDKEKKYIIKMIKEAREELDALERQMAEQEEEEVGFEKDEIFLLSIEEYEKYKDKIPKIDCWWWLRSPGYISLLAAGVDRNGSVYDHGINVTHSISAVRPALKLKGEYDVGARIVLYDFPWVVIDKNLAIAEVPIWFTGFDFDASNCYCSSYIRAYLKNWLENRSEAFNVNCKEF